MEDLVAFASFVTSLLVIVGIIATPVLFFYGRKYFAEKGLAITPMEVTEAISDRLAVMEHKIRDDVSSIIGHAEILATQRHEQVDRQLREMKEALHTALKRSDTALDRATDAKHQAERAMDRIEGLEKRIEDRLATMDKALARIENSVSGGTK